MSAPSLDAQNPVRLVLEGVPRIHFYEGGPRCPEDITLPSVLRATMEYLDEADFGCKHCLAHNPHYSVHNDTVGNPAELRWYGGQFLIEAANFLPYQMAEDLLHAAALYAGEHDLMWKIWDLAGGNGNPEAYRSMPDPVPRRQMADLILQARQKDVENVSSCCQ
jgi:hypothetical protein